MPDYYIFGSNNTTIRIDLKTKDRFLSKIKKTNSCWTWIGGISNNTYGTFAFAKKMRSAHRISWLIYNGPIPHEMCILHKCDNRLCVNPKHLFLGSHSDNVKDKVKKNRQASGEKIGIHKLTNKQVLEIRKRRSYWGIINDLSKEFKVDRHRIGLIRNNKVWTHI